MRRFMVAYFATFGGRPNSAGWYAIDQRAEYAAQGPFETAAAAEFVAATPEQRRARERDLAVSG